MGRRERSGQRRSGQPRAGAAGQRQVTSFLLEPRAASCVAWPVVRAALVVVVVACCCLFYFEISLFKCECECVCVCVSECVCIEEIKIINKLNKSM